MRRRSNINLKLIAQMLVKAGFDHIITVDMHSKESQGFFDTAIDNLRASPFLIQYIQDSVRIALCSRNFQNVKLRLHHMDIFQIYCHSDFT